MSEEAASPAALRRISRALGLDDEGVLDVHQGALTVDVLSVHGGHVQATPLHHFDVAGVGSSETRAWPVAPPGAL